MSNRAAYSLLEQKRSLKYYKCLHWKLRRSRAVQQGSCAGDKAAVKHR